MTSFFIHVHSRDEIVLLDADGNTAASVKWSKSVQGTAIRRNPDGSYSVLSEGDNIVDTLKNLGSFNILLQALEVWSDDNILVMCLQ